MAGGLVKTTIQSLGGGGALFNDVMNVAGGMYDYSAAQKEGNSKAVSLAKAAGSFVFYEMLGPAAWAVIGAQIATSVLPAMAEHTTRTMTQGFGQRGRLGSGYFDMSEAGYTMRQRSLNAIRQNGLNTQSVLGNEARTYFRGSV